MTAIKPEVIKQTAKYPEVLKDANWQKHNGILAKITKGHTGIGALMRASELLYRTLDFKMMITGDSCSDDDKANLAKLIEQIAKLNETANSTRESLEKNKLKAAVIPGTIAHLKQVGIGSFTFKIALTEVQDHFAKKKTTADKAVPVKAAPVKVVPPKSVAAKSDPSDQGGPVRSTQKPIDTAIKGEVLNAILVYPVQLTKEWQKKILFLDSEITKLSEKSELLYKFCKPLEMVAYGPLCPSEKMQGLANLINEVKRLDEKAMSVWKKSKDTGSPILAIAEQANKLHRALQQAHVNITLQMQKRKGA